MASQPLTVLLLLVTTLSCVQMQTVNTTVNYRLPTLIQPSHYIVNLTVPAETFTNASNEFNGQVVITLTTTAVTNTIQLHAHHEFLEISSIYFANETYNTTISNYTVDNVTDILTIGLPVELQTTITYQLFVNFSGNLSTTEMTGFYKSSYVDDSGATWYLATTQFQPSSARRAFPSFDEPLFKATFDIVITYPLNLNALSNTPGTIISSNTTYQTEAFNTTAIMSTYLIAFVISNFTCSNGLIDTVPYQICSRQETNETRDWALQIGPDLLTSLESYTQFRYNRSKEKLDQVAIPDFAAGAMENWGLVTYRELYLLYDNNETSNRYKQFIATIIAHEFAHFWFGNLVTCNWWSETFLNEGFATYFEYFTTHEALPAWQLDKQYVVDVLQPVLINDALENALPLESDVNTPADVMAKFGRISYSKGGSIFRMVEHLMGSTRFRTGIRNYMTQYAYRTVLPENLWTTLNLFLDNTTTLLPEANLSAVMYNWIRNPGFPLLSVTLNGSQVTISQERFLISGNDTTSKWYVPISYTTSEDANKFNNTLPYQWITPSSDLRFNLSILNASWIILNNQETGFYRVTYDNATWNNIRDALLKEEFDGIQEINRAQIVDDLFNLARVNKITYSRIFDIVDFVANDTSYFTWVPTFTGFNFLLARVGLDSRLGEAISSHVLQLMQNLYNSVSFVQHNEDDQIYTFTQVLALSSACRLGNYACTVSSSLLYGFYRATGQRPNKNLRGIIYCNALRHSTNQTDWDFLWNAYQDTSLASEQATILSALGCSRDEQLLEKYLNLSITDDSGIRPQDALSVFSSVYNGNPIGVDVAFRFLRDKHALIAEKYQSMNALPNLINGIAGVFTTQTQVQQLREFIETGDLPAEYLSAANTALESAQANLAWVELFEEDLHAYYFTEDNVTTTIIPPTTITSTTSTIQTTTPTDSAAQIGIQVFVPLIMLILSQFL